MGYTRTSFVSLRRSAAGSIFAFFCSQDIWNSIGELTLKPTAPKLWLAAF